MRTTLPIQHLTADGFADAVRRQLFFLVRVDVGAPRFHAGVVRFFQAEYPDLIGFGTLRLELTRARGWWEQNLRTRTGPAKGGPTGYWLLHGGTVVGHHLGFVRAGLTYTDVSETPADRERGEAVVEWVRRVAFDGRRVPEDMLAAAVEIIAYFDGVISERQARAGFGDAQHVGVDLGQAPRIQPQQVPIPGASGDPFEVLKVSPSASDAELRAAYKTCMKQNHPDKVAHMSDEIRAYAEAQVRVIRAAWDAITSVRSSLK